MLNVFDIAQSKDPFIFTFWDMDDTCVDLHHRIIKNPHLLLPIMLFQSYAPNQHFGLLTNRAKRDELNNDYPIEKFRKELETFGINLSEEHIKFCGGEDSCDNKYQIAATGLDLLAQFLAKLELCENDEFPEQNALRFRQATAAKELKEYFNTTIEPKVFHGKNYHILQFLEKFLNQSRTAYQFEKWSCLKDELNIHLVDDNPNIAKPTANLGKNFVGITASRGGKDLPKEGDTNDDYYSVAYLYDVADKIGFTVYAELPKRFDDQPMLRIAASLYLWQKKDPSVQLIHFKEMFANMYEEHRAYIILMLEYILANSNPKTGYRSVAEILLLLKSAEYCSFLDALPARITSIDFKLAKMKLKTTSFAENMQEVVKTNKSFRLKLGKEKPQAVTPVALTNEQLQTEIKALEEEKQLLVNHLQLLAKLGNSDIAKQAKEFLNIIEQNNSLDIPYNIVCEKNTEKTFTPQMNNNKATQLKKSKSDEDELNKKMKNKEKRKNRRSDSTIK